MQLPNGTAVCLPVSANCVPIAKAGKDKTAPERTKGVRNACDCFFTAGNVSVNAACSKGNEWSYFVEAERVETFHACESEEGKRKPHKSSAGENDKLFHGAAKIGQ